MMSKTNGVLSNFYLETYSQKQKARNQYMAININATIST